MLGHWCVDLYRKPRLLPSSCCRTAVSPGWLPQQQVFIHAVLKLGRRRRHHLPPPLYMPGISFNQILNHLHCPLSLPSLMRIIASSKHPPPPPLLFSTCARYCRVHQYIFYSGSRDVIANFGQSSSNEVQLFFLNHVWNARELTTDGRTVIRVALEVSDR